MLALHVFFLNFDIDFKSNIIDIQDINIKIYNYMSRASISSTLSGTFFSEEFHSRYLLEISHVYE